MRKEVKDNLLQALGAAAGVTPLDDDDAAELEAMKDAILSVVIQWEAYDSGELNLSRQEPKA